MMKTNLSQLEKDRIKKEIKEAFNNVVDECESLDMELAFRVFHNSPDFYMIAPDCSICDYRTYIDNNINYLRECSDFKLTTFDEKIKLLNSDMAVYSWIYKAEATLKTGDRDIVEKAAATFLFEKIDNEWKVTYYHEVSLPPIKVSKNI